MQGDADAVGKPRKRMGEGGGLGRFTGSVNSEEGFPKSGGRAVTLGKCPIGGDTGGGVGIGSHFGLWVERPPSAGRFLAFPRPNDTGGGDARHALVRVVKVKLRVPQGICRCQVSPMGRIGKDRGQLNVNLPAEILNVLDERAKALHLSRSAFAALLMEDWKARGYPGISDADRALQILKGNTPASRRKAV